MPKRLTLFVSKMKQNFTGAPLVRGQIVTPQGSRNDQIILGDATRWTYRYEGLDSDLRICDTEGCTERFIDDDAVRQHRLLVHAPIIDARERARLAALRGAAAAEQRGETIRGLPIEKVKHGPGGPVPYVDARSVLSG